MTITWLHISDFHFREGESYDREVVLKALVDSVGWFRREQNRKPDIVFATGDIAFSGKASEYERATEFLDALIEACGLDRSSLFLVAGNHDVERTQVTGLARTLGTREEADAYFGLDGGLIHLTRAQRNFMQWYNSYFDGIRCLSGASSCGPAEAIEIRGRRIGVLPINSALFCRGDDDHGKLWVGRRALRSAIDGLKDVRADLNLAVLHHPLEWIAEDERASIRALLEGAVDVVLRGHLHENDVASVVGIGGSAIYLAAGAAYQTRRYPNRALYVDVDGDRVTVRPIQYVDSPQEYWVPDTSLFPREPDYVGRFTIPRSGRPIAPTGMNGKDATDSSSEPKPQDDEGTRENRKEKFEKLKKRIEGEFEREPAVSSLLYKKLKDVIAKKMLSSVSAIDTVEAAIAMRDRHSAPRERVKGLVDSLVQFNFEVGKSVLLDVYRTLESQGDHCGMQAIRAVARLLIPWLYVASRRQDSAGWDQTGWDQAGWDNVSLGDIVRIPAGLSTIAEIIMAGIDLRTVSWRSTKEPLGFPQGEFQVTAFEFQPEGGIADTTERNLREDLFRLVKAPREATHLPDDKKDDSIKRRMVWLLRDRGIRVYLVVRLDGSDAIRARQTVHLRAIQDRYPALAILCLDQDLLGPQQDLFDEIRPLLMMEDGE
ncbi:metallophosphoesterase family protein [Roseospira visakhapatnamensis]|uniref:Putative phosphodiesterase n=1 Tax=Roseospira visakhapatnamensis TaxID=390880 RepID=A0A7W6RGQ8_9PROT|nr:metallophosphoesterase [Roseospira visakhapatnamensis]MBB4268002.1 putative phosphodiesterase [Roseospira visakhapatnamensis]